MTESTLQHKDRPPRRTGGRGTECDDDGFNVHGSGPVPIREREPADD